ncbi:hypothetical protein VTJ49DRAFT_6446 [Mycothermus thermophilus]|uniref:DUF3074 domain-containing protein n=1 Tax=Humicola insolens TaxID=85995 RepID=A0ABR3V2R8_HUMIN
MTGQKRKSESASAVADTAPRRSERLKASTQQKQQQEEAKTTGQPTIQDGSVTQSSATSGAKDRPVKKAKLDRENPAPTAAGKEKKKGIKIRGSEQPQGGSGLGDPNISLPVTDHLHPGTLDFLRQLAIPANNISPWLKAANDATYRAARKNWECYVSDLARKIRTVADPTIPDHFPIKDIAWTIYRDPRFASDGCMYKTFFAATFSRSGRHGPHASYTLRLEPDGRSSISGGLTRLERDTIETLRESIDNHPRRWRRVLADRGLWESFLSKVDVPSSDHNNANSAAAAAAAAAGGCGGDGGAPPSTATRNSNAGSSSSGGGGGGGNQPEGQSYPTSNTTTASKDNDTSAATTTQGVAAATAAAAAAEAEVDPSKAIAAFVHLNRSTALVRRPPGCPPNHPDLPLLRLKDFVISAPLDDSVFLDPRGQDMLVGMVKDLVGFVHFLNRIVMPEKKQKDVGVKNKVEGKEVK